MEKSERNYGIDLLRLIAMLFVVLLHCMGKGGILDNAVVNSSQYKVAWFIEICAYSAVDMFALISGYVLYTKKEKPIRINRYIELWSQVVFYGLVVTLVYNILSPSIVNYRDYIISLFPVTNGLYWYFSAYTGLYILMPFLNKALHNCDAKMLKKMFILVIIFFSLFDVLTNRFIGSGYSLIWIMLLYILGAIIRKCNIGNNVKTWKLLVVSFVLIIATFLYKIYGFEFTVLGLKINNDTFISYISPTILGVSIINIIVFSRVRFCNFFQKILKFAAPAAFAVYILNNQKFIWDNIMNNLFVNIANDSVIKIIFYPLVFSLLFLVISIIIDKVRLWFFKIIKIDKLSNYLSVKITNILEKIVSYDKELN